MNNQEPSEQEKNNSQNDPKYWIWGLFYYNPEDNRMFPPKKNQRNGMDHKFCKS